MTPKQQYLSVITLIGWSICSVAGAILVSDEFDNERVLAFGFVLIPSLAIFAFSYFEDPQFWQQRQKAFRGIVNLLMICFLWGNLLLLNAVVRQPVVIGKVFRNDTTDRAMIGAYKKGTLGHLYRFRF